MKLNKKLFFLFSTIFVCSIVAVLFFQHSQEKEFRKTHLNTCLTNYNRIVNGYIVENKCNASGVFELLSLMPDTLLCLHVIDSVGNVIFDNFTTAKIPTTFSTNKGICVSQSSDELYYYTITEFSNFKVCSALPYDQTFENSLSENRYFLIFVGVLLFVVIVLIYFLSKYFYMIVTRDEANLKRQLTQNISHELKTPVSTILGYTETLLLNKAISQEQQTIFVERSYKQAKLLQSLLEDISLLNKLDDARDLYEKQHCDLRAIVSEVLQDLSALIEEKNFSVQLSLPNELPILGNHTLLYSIFRNLLDNALMYAGDNITLSINLTENTKRYYYFSFSDTGKGVAEEHLSYLFNRFYRVDNGRNRKMGGTGLGLAIVKNAIAFHNGEISVKNVVGGGLCFEFSLKKY